MAPEDRPGGGLGRKSKRAPEVVEPSFLTIPFQNEVGTARLDRELERGRTAPGCERDVEGILAAEGAPVGIVSQRAGKRARIGEIISCPSEVAEIVAV